MKDFPYTAKCCCLIEVKKDYSVEQIKHYRKMDLEHVLDAYYRALNNASKLYYVWPGQYTSDLFIVDDLGLFINSFDITT